MMTMLAILLFLALTQKVLSEAIVKQSKTVVLITGCSSGIGQSAAEEFIKHPGYKVL
jgi:NADP-dependent 3-hydroxy acid dehydrogenase YdfG